MAPVLLPLDELDAIWPEKLRGARVGALLHPASVSARLEHASQILERGDGKHWRLRALFGPQHGYLGQTQDNMIEWHSYEHPRLGIPVHSLYGENREPTRVMLENLDVLLIDLQDIGARYYTFVWTMFLCLRACEQNDLPVVVLDRPNPINGITTEGPLLDPAYRSFVGLHPLPVRHGRTIGELAGLFREEAFPCCRLTPFIDAEALTRELNELKLPGAYFREAYFQPGFQKFAGEHCAGAQLHVTNRDLFTPYQTALEIIRTISRLSGELFRWKQPPYEYEFERLPIEVLLGGPVADFFRD